MAASYQAATGRRIMSLGPAMSTTQPPVRWALPVILLVYVILMGTQFARRPVTSFHERQTQTLQLVRQSATQGVGAMLASPTLAFGTSDIAETIGPGSSAAQTATLVTRYELPFHAVFSVLPRILGLGEVQSARLVSILFGGAALLALAASLKQLGVSPTGVAGGAALLAFTPLFVHLSSVPMPDIVALGFYAFAMLCALRKQPVGSAGLAALALLAKPSLIPFLLPLFLLLFGPDVRQQLNVEGVSRMALWVGLCVGPMVGWAASALHDPAGSWNLWQAFNNKNIEKFPHYLFRMKYYVSCGINAVGFGVGLLGILLLPPGVSAGLKKVPGLVGGALGSSAFTYLFMGHYMEQEPQYSLPIIYLGCLVAALGLPRIGVKWLVPAAVAAAIVQACLVGYLWGDRFPHAGNLSAAGHALPIEAKVVQVSASYGASVSYWLERPSMIYIDLQKDHQATLRRYRAGGYTHLAFVDYSRKSSAVLGHRQDILAAKLQPKLWDWCQHHLTRVFEAPGIAVFELKPD